MLNRPAQDLAPALPAERQRRRSLVVGLLIVVCTTLAYLPALRAGYIWDDDDYITNNPVLRDLPGLWRLWTDPTSIPQYYPLVHTTFWVEYHLWGLWSPGYHATNILLHALAAWVLYKLLRGLAVPGALLGAMLFALHPVNVESVAWVTERKNVLCAVFTFSAALVWVRWRRKTEAATLFAAAGAEKSDGARAEGVETSNRRPAANRLYGLMLGLFVCAMLSKTIAATLPPALLLVVWWKEGKIGRRDVVPLLPLFVIGLAGGLFTAHLEAAHVGATGKEFAFTPADRVLIAGHAVAFYAGKLLVPVKLTFIYPKWHLDPRDPAQWCYPAGVAVVLIVLLALRKRIGRAPLAVALIYIVALLPALGFVNVYPMRYSFVADHFQYLATAPALALLGAGIFLVLRRIFARFAIVPASLLLALLAALTFVRTFAFGSAMALWADTLEKNPGSWMVQFHYAEELVKEGEQPGTSPQEQSRLEQQAFDHFKRAVDLAPELPETHWNLGLWYARAHDPKDARAQYEAAIRVDPAFARAYSSLGDVTLGEGDTPGAIALYNKSISLQPGFPVAHYRLGVALEKAGRPQDALREYAAAVNLRPEDPDFRYNLANLLLHTGDLRDAIYHYQMLLQDHPENAEARTNYGAALLAANQPAAAAEQFAVALREKPGLVPAQRGLAKARQMLAR